VPVEDRDIARLDYGAAFSEVDINASLGNGDSPEEFSWAGWRKIGWVQVVDLWARTGLKDINSDKRKRPAVHLPILPAKDTLHETHIRRAEGE